jgi:hypothetical protein
MLRAPTASLLAKRDLATMAILGLQVSNFGSRFAGEFGDDVGDDYGADVGDDVGDIAAEMGAEFGDEVGAAVAAKLRGRRRPQRAAPANPAIQAAWQKHQMEKARTQRRAAILNPNQGSGVKVERYAFSISTAIVIGTGAGIAITGQPDTTIRPQRVSMNAPSTNYVFINEIKVANVSVTVGAGAEDAFNYNPMGVGQSLDMPTLSPANRATVLGTYTGYVPPGFTAGMNTQFTVTFKGPASVIA